MIRLACGCGARHAFTLDDARRKPKTPSPVQARKAERQYSNALGRAARQIGEIVRGFAPLDPALLPAMRHALERYGAALEPWARAVGGKMLAEVSIREERAWAERTAGMGRALRDEIRNAPAGEVMRAQLAQQVDLITSMPRDAAERVQRLTMQALEDSGRAASLVEEIQRTGKVVEARARLIARTEVGRTQSLLTEARAVHIGSEGYIWRTAKDTDVRPSHKAMQGKFVAWIDPPTLDGMTGHAGALPNCRCYADVVIPD